MELTTLFGMLMALLGLLGGMYFKGVPFSALGNPAAIFIIFGEYHAKRFLWR